MKFTIPERYDRMMLDPVVGKSKEVYSFGLDYVGDVFTNDTETRGDEMQRDVTSEVTPILHEIRRYSAEYVVYLTHEPRISLLAPKTIPDEYLLEVYVLAFLANIQGRLFKIDSKVRDPYDKKMFALNSVLIALNGENDWNYLNGLVDFQYKSFIGRDECQMSMGGWRKLSPRPIQTLAQQCDVLRDPVPIDGDLYTKAKQIAYDYLKQTFFAD